MTNHPETQAELVEHLAELRARLIRAIIYIAIGMVIAWFVYDWLFAFLTRPMTDVLVKTGSKFLLTGFPEAFMIQVQVCMVAGLILMSPFVTMEVWGFVSPGLTSEEKRPMKWVVPLAAFLFASGVVLCYIIMPYAFRWFALYVPKGAELRPSVQSSVLFTVKMLFAFGLAFELPVVLMLLGKIGIVNSEMLSANWRHLVVAICVMAAIITPSNDAFSMLCMAIPMGLLFLISIFLVWLVEEKRSTADIFSYLFGWLPFKRRAKK